MRKMKWTIWILIIAAAGWGCSSLTPYPAEPETIHFSGGGTTGPLAIRRIELQFSNGRAEMTVPRNGRLAARAIVQVKGNGFFKGAWVVDDQVVEIISTMVTFGDTLTIDMAPSTILPTFDPGRHRLTLKIDQPLFSGLTIPNLFYTVTVNEK
jgi:hypothetical protein